MRRRSLLPLAALASVLLINAPGWAPPAPRLSAQPPAPRPPVTTPRPPVAAPNSAGVAALVAAARQRNAAEAAALLRQQGATALSRVHRATLLNVITHDTLHQKQTVPLAELRRLRADWVALGPGSGLDPIVAMQLEAAEAGAERLFLADGLELIAAGRFAEAFARFEPLELPRYLPVSAVRALPELREALRRVAPFAQSQAALRAGDADAAVRALSKLPNEHKPLTVANADEARLPLVLARATFGDGGTGAELSFVRRLLADVEKHHGATLARQLRTELAARLFLAGRAADATALVGDGVDPAHASQVLADLRAATLGRDELKNPQIAAVIAADRTQPPAYSAIILPPDRLAQWRPAVPNPGNKIVDVAEAAAREKVTTALNAEVTAGTARVRAAAERIREALATEAAPRKAFLDKIEVARGKPFVTPAERELALVAGTRGHTVAEAVGVLAAEPDRPAAAVRLLAVVPAFVHAGEFAAAVERSGRAPAAFAAYPAAGDKLPPACDRSRVREAVHAALHAQAGHTVSGREPPPFARSEFEAGLRDRLKLPPGETPSAAECVQGLLDVCRDGAAEYAQLLEAFGDLNQAIPDIERGVYDRANATRKELETALKLRRLSVLADKKRCEIGLAVGCQLLSAYGPDAAPARDWLRAQSEGTGTPWGASAADALEKIGAK
ncbi:hypothetical protein GobsT_65370 [Gemmata obscuriglobus]|uniref:Uncharacterized protein n=1 Tax=Gemmata obscuriglobus TaxID=114 RepID=A0A2Z3GNG4_9BACT|nr:hypothetical protein [Gemmata obscuriglobus]AWM35769.1 hypothetical protein C1280_01165 [Gemmata obscuriglobus]QEG31693.1 hypothetical protein GobsT_65370 [Gemmata obscuriglobus]VTS11039.1 unnamed protein product [Gemmata obscuriglobus UQM 2246]